MIRRKGIVLLMSASLLLMSFTSGGASARAEGELNSISPPPAKLQASQEVGLHFPNEIVIKLKPGIDVERLSSGARLYDENSEPSTPISWNALSPLFQQQEQPLTTYSMGDESVFDRYYTLPVPHGADVGQMIQELKSNPFLEEAYEKPQPVTPPSITLQPNTTPVQLEDDPNFPLQGYALAAPQGINAPYAWQFEGGDGKGINWADIEYGWALSHEDLVDHAIQLLPGSINGAYYGHGTAVLGQVAAVDNSIGNLGIAHKAQPFVSSQVRTNGSYNTAEAILAAANALSPGDVILIEAQAGYPTASGYVPVEVYPAEFDAIQYAVKRGISVVEAAGNGSVDLDQFVTLDGKYILNPNHPDFKDSGAIIVGAASASLPHSRMYFSTYGNRINAYAWGSWDVHTLDAVEENSTTGYTSTFAGTSAASPIITGAAIALQGLAKAQFGVPYTPEELRSLMQYAPYNTASADHASDKMAYMPNLELIIKNLPEPGQVPRDTVAPAAPTGITATKGSNNSITLNWNVSSDDIAVIGYDVFINGSLIPTVWTSGTTATIESLKTNTTYELIVRARDGANNLSQASEQVQVTFPAVEVCVEEKWSATKAYTKGQKVSFNGVIYEASWWTQNQQPDVNSGSYSVWKVIGKC